MISPKPQNPKTPSSTKLYIISFYYTDMVRAFDDSTAVVVQEMRDIIQFQLLPRASYIFERRPEEIQESIAALNRLQE